MIIEWMIYNTFYEYNLIDEITKIFRAFPHPTNIMKRLFAISITKLLQILISSFKLFIYNFTI